MDLSPDQLRVHDAVLDWLRNPREKLLTLGGAAGSGKSTLLGELSKHFPTPTAYVTPTGRAASVLARKLVESGTRITKLQRPPDGKKLSAKWRHLFDASLPEGGGPPLCTTYHRLLLRPIVDSQTEELLGWQDRDDMDRRYKLIVVDECFHYEQRILTEDGWQTIGKVVENKLQCRVWSFNKETHALELKPIVRWIKNPAPESLLKIDASRTGSMRNARVIRCTPEHKILTPTGYVRAGELKVGDDLIVLTPACMAWKVPGGNFQPKFVAAAQTTVAPIRSIGPTSGRSYGIASVYDIEVSDNHNYVAGNIVVSNCSMVSDNMFLKIRARGVPILAVGDHWQLPPVRDSGTLMKNPTLRLEQVHRQAEGSSIVALSRFVYEGGRIRDFKGWNADCVLRQKNEEEAVVREMLTENRLGVVAIAWTNKTRVKFNRLARDIQGYSGVPVVGEPLVSLHNYGPICNGSRGLLAKESFLDERRDWILHANVEFPEDNMAGEWHELNGHQFNRPHKFEKVDELRSLGIPAETIGGGGRLFDFSYCMTCHRAQGSQFDHVIVLYERDRFDEESRRWNYTSISRAAKKLTILLT